MAVLWGQQGGVLSRWGATPIFLLPTSQQIHWYILGLGVNRQSGTRSRASLGQRNGFTDGATQGLA